jgi:hypothetical protein
MARSDDTRETEAEGPALIGPEVERLVRRCLERARVEDAEAEAVVAGAGESHAATASPA